MNSNHCESPAGMAFQTGGAYVLRVLKVSSTVIQFLIDKEYVESSDDTTTCTIQVDTLFDFLRF